jgi:PAS domain-containing protein
MSLDWTRNFDIPVSGYTRFLQTYDWASTSLGPMQNWPNALRLHVCQIVSHPEPRIVLWGPDLAFLYNEAAINIMEQRARHPDSLGQPSTLIWKEGLDAGLRDIITSVTTTGKSIRVEDFLVPLLVPQPLCSDGPGSFPKVKSEPVQMIAQESYFTFTIAPIFDEHGEVAGVVDEFTETTKHVIANRRINTVIRLEDNANTAHSLSDVWKLVLAALDPNVEDVPFALLYSILDNAQITSPNRFVLEGAVGISADHPISNLIRVDSCFQTWVQEACVSGKPTIVSYGELMHRMGNRQTLRRRGSQPELKCQPTDQDNTTAFASEDRGARPNSEPLSNLIESPLKSGNNKTDNRFVVPGRGHDENISSVMILPIPRLSRPDTIGVVVMAMNPLRLYDSAYQSFIRQFTESVVRAVAAINVPQEQRRHQQAAQEMSLRHAAVSAHLLQRTKTAERTEARFRYLAEKAPVGMCLFGSERQAIWANKAYLDHLNISNEELNPLTWKASIHPDDHSLVDENWNRLESHLSVGPFELRIQKRDRPTNEDEYVWLLCDATAQYDETGKIETITSW